MKLRCSISQEDKQGLVKQLQEMLHHDNKSIEGLKTTINIVPQNCEKFQVVIHADRKPAKGHRGCYNAATSDEVALEMVGQKF